uniref:Reverse transcriptase Ty1/copia-type domain-containing protein n=1 Tax=Vitis vinifera TaxID=29760 RepID=A5AID5_VITVI|nr:hypothetical protein VITISV_023815 [Vitis vinifera]
MVSARFRRYSRRAAKLLRSNKLSSQGCEVGFHLEVLSFQLAAYIGFGKIFVSDSLKATHLAYLRSIHKIHDGLIKTNIVQDLLEGDHSAPITGKWDTLLRSVINYTDILQDTQRNDYMSIVAIKKFLHSQFRLKNLGNLKYLLGIEVFSSKNGILISQCKYALEIIKDAGLLGVTPIDTPMERGLKLSDKRDLLKDPSHYRRLVGRLIYLTISRPDITYFVHVLSRFMYQPRKLHMEVALRVVRFLKNAPGQGLFFSSNCDFRLRAYCDLDWVGCPIIRRFMNSAHQLVDVLTKALGKEVFTLMIRKLGVQDIHSPT